MERQILIRNIAYMERELSEMKRELAQLDARWEHQEKIHHHRADESLLLVEDH